MRACGSISAILTAPGNAAPTRTLTDCCASTFPKGPISAFTAPTKLQPWPPPSTRGPERRLIGRRPQRRLTSFSYQPTKTALRRPLESAMYASIGSYLARITRIFDLRYSRYPDRRLAAVLSVLNYVNFFSHHYLPDIRVLLFLLGNRVRPNLGLFPAVPQIAAHAAAARFCAD